MERRAERADGNHRCFRRHAEAGVPCQLLLFSGFDEDDRGRLTFTGVAKYRLGPTNDEGWYPGQCRFSGIAPVWGEFYEVGGELFDDDVAGWKVLTPPTGNEESRKRYLFYLRGATFECDAFSWRFEVI